jgi:hypothetical protein
MVQTLSYQDITLPRLEIKFKGSLLEGGFCFQELIASPLDFPYSRNTEKTLNTTSCRMD